VSERGNKRVYDGALSALKTPSRPPSPARLVGIAGAPRSSTGEEGSARDRVPAEGRGDRPDGLPAQARAELARESDVRTAIEVAYEAYASMVRNYVDSLLDDPEEAEEVTAEAFVRLTRRLIADEQPKAPTAALLVSLARHMALDRLASRRVGALTTLPLAEPIAEKVVDQRMLDLAMAALPEAENQVLVLHYLGQLSFEEIAEVLGKSQAWVRGHLHRAHHRLVKELARAEREAAETPK
jgi:RNA polymerase sigma factor (sigma-70 family)